MDLAASARQHANLYFGMERLIRGFVVLVEVEVEEQESIVVGGEGEGMGRVGVVVMVGEKDNAVEIVVVVGIGISSPFVHLVLPVVPSHASLSSDGHAHNYMPDSETQDLIADSRCRSVSCRFDRLADYLFDSSRRSRVTEVLDAFGSG